LPLSSVVKRVAKPRQDKIERRDLLPFYIVQANTAEDFVTFYPYISMILTLTGIIALAGIVVNNNIVLIDAYQRFREHGYDAKEAAVRTAAQRLRPVFLTTLTTVVGLMPLILGWGANIFTGELDLRGTSTSEIWAPISFVIASGLGFATILTLIVTPVLLAAPTVVMERIKKFRKA